MSAHRWSWAEDEWLWWCAVRMHRTSTEIAQTMPWRTPISIGRHLQAKRYRNDRAGKGVFDRIANIKTGHRFPANNYFGRRYVLDRNGSRGVERRLLAGRGPG